MKGRIEVNEVQNWKAN